MFHLQQLEAARVKATEALLAARVPGGHWEGELSSSALSTATAVTALAVRHKAKAGASEPETAVALSAIDAGWRWLAQHANADGGWGDTVLSVSNISTTTLCWAAFGAAPGAEEKFRPAVEGAARWLTHAAGGTEPERLVPAILRRYGKDRTFSVPILTMSALAGRLGQGREAWRRVRALPFELAACPHQWFAALRLPVVSYALPALIAIGQARHHHLPTRNPITRLLRNATRTRTLRILSEIQPASGGFLEATPLTSFVAMSLAGSGLPEHEVTRRCVGFLLASQRRDGSWPIDTNLATWLTTMAVDALEGVEERALVAQWLLDQQHRDEHPYTHAAPGGWAWTNLSGGVPDADDTAGAIIALKRIAHCRLPIADWPDGTAKPEAQSGFLSAAEAGVRWLLGVQNRDGGMPTFCRGWGALPFDRSSADITAHAIRGWLAWTDALPARLRTRVLGAVRAAVGFLARAQQPDGSWVPLWFGNQHVADDQNPTYGTARVLCALAELVERAEVRNPLVATLFNSGVNWLVKNQNADGGWGGSLDAPSSVEETALAVSALAAWPRSNVPAAAEALERGVFWLIQSVECSAWTQPAPIGFYFAKLWYHERLYPMIFTVAALNAARRALGEGGEPG
ncbi:MAG: squalene--hopene cyclase [Verrucomicrobia bacterium]|nr:squalene--hopene cyclase [Verrucomicrobiota bacterium]